MYKSSQAPWDLEGRQRKQLILDRNYQTEGNEEVDEKLMRKSI